MIQTLAQSVPLRRQTFNIFNPAIRQATYYYKLQYSQPLCILDQTSIGSTPSARVSNPNCLLSKPATDDTIKRT